jgi:hypothetical protein
VLQAAGLRLLCRLWQGSGGRAFQPLRTAVIGFAAPGQKPGLLLRAALAECLRDICAADPDRAVELVGLLQVGERCSDQGSGTGQCRMWLWLSPLQVAGRSSHACVKVAADAHLPLLSHGMTLPCP